MTGVVGRSVESITGALRAVFTAEQIAGGDGFLQRRDPRVTLVAIAGLAVAVMVARTITVTLLFAAVTLGLARLSAVPFRRLLARAAVVPLVSSLIVLPQAVLLPGEAVVAAFGLTVTDAGIAYVVFFTLRVGVGVALLSLLVLTTPFSAVIAALRELRVPVALVWVIAVTYRYLFLFFDELQRLVLARNSRTKGESTLRGGWRDSRRLAGTFLLRTLDRGERVGRGMRARGGARPPSPYSHQQPLDTGDYALLVGAAAAVLGVGVIRWGL